jgi:hypothetical protein
VEGPRHLGALAAHTGWHLADTHALDPPVLRVDPRHLRERDDLDAELPRRLGEAPDERPGEDDSVVGIERRRDDAVGRQLGDDLLRLARRQHPRREPALALELAARLERTPPLLAAREEEVPALAEPDVDLELARELLAETDALLHQPDVRFARPLRADPAAVAPARAAAEVTLVEHRHVRDAQAREVVGDRQAHDARADDDDLGVISHDAAWNRRSASAWSTGFAASMPRPCATAPR